MERDRPSAQHRGTITGDRGGLVAAALGDTPTIVTGIGWAFFGLLVVLMIGQLFKGVDPQDEGQFLTYPWLIAHGYMPYRDVWMSYPPAVYCMLAVLFKLGLPGLAAERGMALLSVLAYVLLVNRLVTGAWTRFSWVAVPLTYSMIFMSSDIRAYPWLLGLPLFLLGLHLVRAAPAAAACLFFFGGTLRFEFVAGGLVALAVSTVLPGTGRGRPLRLLAIALALTAVTVAFYLVLDAVTAHRALQAIFFDQVGGVEAARRLPLFPPQFSPLGWPALLLSFLGPVAMVAVGLRTRRGDVAAMSLAVLALSPHFFQRADSSHLFSFAALAAPCTMVALAEIARHASGISQAGSRFASRWPFAVSNALLRYTAIAGAGWSTLIVAAYAVYLSPLSPLAPAPISGLHSRLVAQGARTIIAWNPDIARDDRQIASFLHHRASSSQSVFITPLSVNPRGAVHFYYTMTDLYYVLGMKPASRYLEMQGGVSTRPSVLGGLMHDLQHCDWVVLLHGGAWYTGPRAYRDADALAYERYINRHFRPVLSNPTYQLMARGTGA